MTDQTPQTAPDILAWRAFTERFADIPDPVRNQDSIDIIREAFASGWNAGLAQARTEALDVESDGDDRHVIDHGRVVIYGTRVEADVCAAALARLTREEGLTDTWNEEEIHCHTNTQDRQMPASAKKVDGQIPAFFEEDAIAPEVPYVGPGVERHEIVHRAGTALNHHWTHKILGKGKKGTRLHGMLDESQRVYQTGGELSRFIFWKKHLVSIDIDAWNQIRGKVDWLEVIDHERNECWRIPAERFIKNAVRYDAGIGPRVGAHTDHWTVITSRGTIRKEGR